MISRHRCEKTTFKVSLWMRMKVLGHNYCTWSCPQSCPLQGKVSHSRCKCPLCGLDSEGQKHSFKGLPLNFQVFTIMENMRRIYQQRKWNKENLKVSSRTFIWKSRKSAHSIFCLLCFSHELLFGNILGHRRKFNSIEYIRLYGAPHKQCMFTQRIFIKHILWARHCSVLMVVPEH